MPERLRRAAFLWLSLVMAASNSFAVGGAAIGNEVLSARALGQGLVGTAAQNNDPVVVYSNPAGLSKIEGTVITLGGTWENLHGNYEANTGQKIKMRSLDVGVPNFAVSHRWLDGKLGTGFGVFSPYGLETHWPGDSSLRYVATNSKIHLTLLTSGVSYQVHPMVSFGAGLTYVNTFDALLERNVNVDNLNFALSGGTELPTGRSDAVSKLEGTGTSWGFQTGILIEPHEQHSFGLTYHSKMKLHLNGTASISGLSGITSPFVFGGSDYETSAYTDIFLPQNIQFGYSYKPTDKWMFEVDTAWYDWTSSKDLNIRYAETNPSRMAVLNTGNPQNFDWHTAWSVATGTNYKWSDKLQLRGGFWYEARATPEATFTPAIMDLSRYSPCIGFGYGLTSHLTLDMAYNAIFFKKRIINNNLGQNATGDPTVNINGSYTNFVNLVAVNLTYRF